MKGPVGFAQSLNGHTAQSPLANTQKRLDK